MREAELIRWAEREARFRMRPLGRRWAHVQATADLARRMSLPGGSDESAMLVAATLLHDIGYSDDLAATGFIH